MRLACPLLPIATLLSVACSGPPPAQPTATGRASEFPPSRPDAPEHVDAQLQREIESLAAVFKGVAGIYVRRLDDGRCASLRADETFPAASLIKVPILLGVFARLERAELDYRARLPYDASRAYPGEDLLARFQAGETIALSELCTLMCTFSDNTAALWCQELAGSGTAINAWLDRAGYVATRVNSRTGGREEHHRAFGWGQTTPREMAELLVAIRARRAVAPAADEEMERLLSRSYWTGEAVSALPPTVHAMSKQGALSASRCEVLLVDGPSGPWVLCVLTRDQEDRSWRHENEGYQLLRDVTQTVWRRFEPDAPWTPAQGGARFRR